MKIVSMRSCIGAVVPAALAAFLVLGAVAPGPVQAEPRADLPSSPCSVHVGKLEFMSPQAVPGRFSTLYSTIAVTCAPTTSFTLRLVSANGCKLRRGDETLRYALFLDQAGENALLNCGPSKLTYSGTGSAILQLYGRTSTLPGYSATSAYRVGRYDDEIDVELEAR
jgi:spore coat protein U-like protein